jgi:hypothetical protein
MHTKTKFVANDGSEYDDAAHALKRDEMIVAVEKALSNLSPIPDDINFLNGHGYIQQEQDGIGQCKWDLYQIANQEGVLKWWIDDQKNKHGKTDDDLVLNCHPSYFCRMLDGDHEPLDRAYNRLCCIDKKLREWGQMYYVSHPEAADQICLNADLSSAG